MNSMYKSLILAVVVGLYVFIAGKIEYTGILNFVLLYIILTIVTWLIQKSENRSNEKTS